jgi:hypothetical protein
MTYKPIKTNYNGIDYKSRLEARWQMFFDDIGILAVYEPFLIEKNGVQWVPDFILNNGTSNDCRIAIEIKPIVPNDEYIQRLFNLYDPKKGEILILIGRPCVKNTESLIFTSDKNGKSIGKGVNFVKCSKCGRFTIQAIDDFSYLTCEAYHPIDGFLHPSEAAEKATYFRFDLI